MKQYLDLCQRIVDEGIWVENERTGKNITMWYAAGGLKEMIPGLNG